MIDLLVAIYLFSCGLFYIQCSKFYINQAEKKPSAVGFLVLGMFSFVWPLFLGAYLLRSKA